MMKPFSGKHPIVDKLLNDEIEKIDVLLRSAGVINPERSASFVEPYDGDRVNQLFASEIRHFDHDFFKRIASQLGHNSKNAEYLAKQAERLNLHQDNVGDVRKELDQAIEWVESEVYKMIAPQHSILKAALTELAAVTEPAHGLKEAADLITQPGAVHSIIITHDWAKLLGNSSETEGEWRLPYPVLCFEFAFDKGHRACVIAAEDDDGTVTLRVMCRTPKFHIWHWDDLQVVCGPNDFTVRGVKANEQKFASMVKIREFMYRQVRAACIMLEAEVAEVEPLRSSYKSNKPPKEAKERKFEITHGVLSVNKRRRYTELSPELRSPGSQKRLHFRCGHWRHYPNHKTWIKWQLVGNPELGWVEKEYRL